MTAILELAAVSTFTCTAASTLGLAGYGHSKAHGCMGGMFSKTPRHHQKEHTLDPPHHDELTRGPIRHKGCQVRMNGSSVGKQPIEFNGEILSVGSSTSSGKLVPTLALGACNVKVNGSKVVAEPPSLPTVEITFGNENEAVQWAKEFQESAMVGPPQERIQELIVHSMKVEKHITDLRARSEKVSELEAANKKLNKKLKLVKCGIDGPQPLQRTGTGTALASLFSGFSGSGGGTQDLEEQLRARELELSQAKDSNGKLKDKIRDHASSDSNAAVRWRSLVNAYVARMKELEDPSQSGRQTNESESIDASARDPNIGSMPVVVGSQEQQNFAIGQQCSARMQSGGGSARSTQERLTKEFEQWFMNVEHRLEYSRQHFLEEKGRTNYTGVLMTPGSARDNDSADEAMRQLELLSAVSDNRFRSLEERILNHQFQVDQDCNVLQETLKAQLI